MGWDGTLQTVKEAKADKRKAMAEIGTKILAEKSRTGVWWLALEQKDGSRLIVAYLVDRRGGWTYFKGITESMGPAETNCPPEFFALVPAPESKWSQGWREEVLKTHAIETAKKITKKLNEKQSTEVA